MSESLRWIEGYERVAEQATQMSQTRLVYVADRESDMVALMRRARELEHAADWLVRARHNRVLPDGERLWSRVGSSEPLGEIRVTLPSSHGRKAREVVQQICCSRLDIPDGATGTLTISCLIAREVDPPADTPPLQWRLLTNREVTDLAGATQLIDWYRARWEVEIFFNVLKNGCRVEVLQLASIERAIALFMIIAWRIARLMRQERISANVTADSGAM